MAPVSWSLLGSPTAASAGDKDRDRTVPGLGLTSPNLTVYRLFGVSQSYSPRQTQKKRGGHDSSYPEIDGAHPLWTMLL